MKIVWDQKVRNDIERITKLLQPFKANLQIVVESTFNWYWLVDGLQAAGFDVVLAHTPGLHLITKAKVKTDRRDALALAKLLLAGVIPKAYIYPVETRPVRDLLRQRAHLVQRRAGEYGSLRRMLLRQGILSSKKSELQAADAADLEQWFDHPMLRMRASQELQRIALYSHRSRKWSRPFLGWPEKSKFTRLSLSLLEMPFGASTI